MNLILITIDCLRADHLNSLAYSKKTTPNLDYLASTGVFFNQAISVSTWTPSSFIAMFTSTYPLMYGGQVYATNSRTAIAQVLKEHGYYTGAFHSNPWLSSYYGYNKGFNTFDDSMQERGNKRRLDDLAQLVKSKIGTNGRLYKLLSAIYGSHVEQLPFIKAEALNRKAISWVRSNPNNFFLWIHYMDLHEPYIANLKIISPSERRRIMKLSDKAFIEQSSLSQEEIKELIYLYDTQLIYVDRHIGSILQVLEQRDITENTFVIVTADHGQQFAEHGYVGHSVHLYDELIHVPLIVSGPGLASQVINQQVSLLDLAPTILDMLKIEKHKAFLGNSLVPLISGDRAEAGNLEAISEGDITKKPVWDLHDLPRLDVNHKQISLRTGEWKYIYTEGGEDELYRLEDDPNETRDIIDIEPEIATHFRARIMAHIEFEDKSTPSEEELIKAKIGKLKSSGRL